MFCHIHAHHRTTGASEHCHWCKFWLGEILSITLFISVISSVGAQLISSGGSGGGDAGSCLQGTFCSVSAQCGGGVCVQNRCLCGGDAPIINGGNSGGDTGGGTVGGDVSGGGTNGGNQPVSPELCNGLDDDNDGAIDENFPDLGSQCTVGIGACQRTGQMICTIDMNWTTCSVTPGASNPETCNDGIDDDCDGEIDEGCSSSSSSCTEGAVQSCTTGLPGVCSLGTQTCTDTLRGSCFAQIAPGTIPESCTNTQDDDCDGQINEGCTNSSDVNDNPSSSNSSASQSTTSSSTSSSSSSSSSPAIGTTTHIYFQSDPSVSNTRQNDTSDERIYPSTSTTNETTDSLDWIYFNNLLHPGATRPVVATSQKSSVDTTPVSPVVTPTSTSTSETKSVSQTPVHIQTFARDRSQLLVKPSVTTPIKPIKQDISDVPLPKDIVLEGLYLQLDPALETGVVKLFNSMKQKHILSSYYQPFLSIENTYYRVEFDKEKFRALTYFFSKVPGVTDIQPIPLFTIQQFASEGTTGVSIDQRYLHNIQRDELLSGCLPSEIERPITLAIVDNAFDTTHPALKGRVRKQFDVSDADSIVSPPMGANGDWAHGTIAAGISAGEDPDIYQGISLGFANLLLVKSTSDDSAGSDITHGMEAVVAAADAGAQVLSLSRGTAHDIPLFRDIIQKLIKKGVTIVAAAGNQSTQLPFYPAAYDKVLAVGAYDKQEQKALFSNYGPRVDVMAPGVELMAPGLEHKYIVTQGTSEAAPLVAGVVTIALSTIGNEGIVDGAWPTILSDQQEDIDGIPKLRIKALCSTTGITTGTTLPSIQSTPIITQEHDVATGGEDTGSVEVFGGQTQPKINKVENIRQRLVTPTAGILYISIAILLFLISLLTKKKPKEPLANEQKTAITQ